MRSILHRLLVAAVTAVSAGIVGAADDPSSSRPELERLVYQLGSADFADREQAQRNLLEIGSAALPALRRATGANDLELRYRARQIILELQSRLVEEVLAQLESGDPTVTAAVLPGWKRYSRLMGDSEETRRLFVEMVRAEPALMGAVDGSPEQTWVEFERRCADVWLRRGNRQRNGLPVPSVAALLFVGTLDECRPSAAALRCMESVILNDGDFATEMGRTDGSGSVRQLVGLWIVRPDAVPAALRLNIAYRFELYEGMEIARDVIQGGQNGDLIQKAILFIARFGSRDNIAELEELLDNDTPLPTPRRSASASYSLRVQDVALAGLLHLTEQDAKGYGFEIIRDNSQFVYNIGSMGFNTDEEREAALQKWHAWRGEHFKDMLPFIPQAVEGTTI